MSKAEAIKASVFTHEVVEQITGVAPKSKGSGHWKAICPFHDDTDPSLSIMPDGNWVCFACGAKGGDVISLVAKHRGISDADAIRALFAEQGVGHMDPKTEAPKKKKAKQGPKAGPAETIPDERLPQPGQVLTLRLEGLRNGREKAPMKLSPSVVHVYRNQLGDAEAVVLRVERDGDKDFFPARWAGGEWWAVAQSKPRQMYGLENVGPSTAQVVVVEGEKACDAANARLPIPAVSWPGGANAVKWIDWSPLRGRKVVLWPDNDAAGVDGMHAMGDLIAEWVDEIKMIDPTSLGPKDDAADLDPDIAMVEWLKAHASVWAPPVRKPDVVPGKGKPGDPPGPFQSTEQREEAEKQYPFLLIGQRERRAVFLKKKDGRLYECPFERLLRTETMLELGPKEFWKTEFGGLDKEGQPLSWQLITHSFGDMVHRKLAGMGDVDDRKIRGRGMWKHHSRLAFNRGDVLEVDGERQGVNYVDQLLYERRPTLPVAKGAPLTNDEGRRLIDTLSLCSWADPSFGMLLAGWMAIAPLSGALEWRPHVWVTGASSTGKTTIVNKVVYDGLGHDWAIRLSGGSTEAGIRQSLRNDALPVVYDEGEPGKGKMKSVIDQARNASSGDTTIKGSAGGEAKAYTIRSMFCFAAINTSVASFADESRITRLVTRKGTDDGRYLQFEDDVAELITADFGTRLAARSILHVRNTLQSIRVLEDAVSDAFGSRRLAQQYGAMLGGAWSLEHTDVITRAEADVLAQLVPQESIDLQEEASDEMGVVHMLTSHRVAVTTKAGRQDWSLGELIQRMLHNAYMEGAEEVQRDEAEAALRRSGVGVYESTHNNGGRKVRICVAKRMPYLRDRIFRDTDWADDYTSRLMDLQGSTTGPQLRFAGSRYRTVLVKTEHFDEEFEE